MENDFLHHHHQLKAHCQKCGRRRRLFPTQYPKNRFNEKNILIDQFIEVQQLGIPPHTSTRSDHYKEYRQPQCYTWVDTNYADRFKRVQQMIYLRENINK